MPGDHGTDFSKEHIEKQVNREIASHSMTLFPAAAGVLGLLWGALFAAPAALVLGGLAVATSVGFFSLQKFGRFGKLTSAYLLKLKNDQREMLLKKLSTIAPELADLGCHQGAAQVEILKAKFDGLNQMIQEKLGHDELKASRLSAIADKLYLATIDNLLHARQILSSVENIDLNYVEKQIARAHSVQERESLEQRRQLKLDGVNAAEDCIAHNEVAMTKVNQLTVELARTKDKNSRYDMEESLHEITNQVRVDQWVSQ